MAEYVDPTELTPAEPLRVGEHEYPVFTSDKVDPTKIVFVTRAERAEPEPRPPSQRGYVVTEAGPEPIRRVIDGDKIVQRCLENDWVKEGIASYDSMREKARKIDEIRELVDTHRQRGTALAYLIREVIDR